MKNSLFLLAVLCLFIIFSAPSQALWYNVNCNFYWEDNPDKNIKADAREASKRPKGKVVQEKEKKRIMKVNPAAANAYAEHVVNIAISIIQRTYQLASK